LHQGPFRMAVRAASPEGMSPIDPEDETVAGPFPGLGYGAPINVRRFTAVSGSDTEAVYASVAEEVPVAFVYRQRTHAVMMATPADLEDLAVGFTLSERIVEDARDISRVTVSQHSRGIELKIDVPAAAADRLTARTRALAGRTGCGLCGVEAIDDAVRVPVRV